MNSINETIWQFKVTRVQIPVSAIFAFDFGVPYLCCIVLNIKYRYKIVKDSSFFLNLQNIIN